MKLRIRGARQVVQVVADGRRFLREDEMKSLAIMEMTDEDKDGFSIVVDK